MHLIKSIPNQTGEKLLYSLNDGAIIEVAVFAYNGTEKNGIHICMPSQVGCSVGCSFCATTHSPIPFLRSLSKNELIEIVHLIRQRNIKYNHIDVISFSGHGEPLLNYAAVIDCIKAYEHSIGKGFITTVGRKQVFDEIIQQKIIPPAQFFFSLHGSTDEQRQMIIPKHPWMASLADLQVFSRYLLSLNEVVTFNYMLAQHNTSEDSAKRLADYLSEIGNVSIRFTPVFAINNLKKSQISSNKDRFLNAFSESIQGESISWRISNPTGSEIGIACGQMRAHILDKEALI